MPHPISLKVHIIVLGVGDNQLLSQLYFYLFFLELLVHEHFCVLLGCTLVVKLLVDHL